MALRKLCDCLLEQSADKNTGVLAHSILLIESSLWAFFVGPQSFNMAPPTYWPYWIRGRFLRNAVFRTLVMGLTLYLADIGTDLYNGFNYFHQGIQANLSQVSFINNYYYVISNYFFGGMQVTFGGGH